MGNIGKIKRVLEVLPTDLLDSERIKERPSSPDDEQAPSAPGLKDPAHG